MCGFACSCLATACLNRPRLASKVGNSNAALLERQTCFARWGSERALLERQAVAGMVEAKQERNRNGSRALRGRRGSPLGAVRFTSTLHGSSPSSTSGVGFSLCATACLKADAGRGRTRTAERLCLNANRHLPLAGFGYLLSRHGVVEVGKRQAHQSHLPLAGCAFSCLAKALRRGTRQTR